MQTFLKVLDPEDTSTGGGSASAIAGAMAASLLAMVIKLSLAGAQGEGERALLDRVHTRAGELSRQLLEGSRHDSQAFQAVRSAYRLPKQSLQEKAARHEAVQAAWLIAARVPLENAQHCMDVLELGAYVDGWVNPNVSSDYRCALLLARAGLLGCLENVHINLPEIKDTNLAERLAARSKALTGRLAILDASQALDPPVD